MRLKNGARLSRCKIVPLKPGNNPWFEVTLTQGRNRQIREMFEALGHPVQKLRRTRIGFISDTGLSPGQYRHLNEREIARFLKTARVKQNSAGEKERLPKETVMEPRQ